MAHNDNMVLIKKWVFFWPKNLDFRPENPLFAIGPQISSMAHLWPSARKLISHPQNDYATFRFRETRRLGDFTFIIICRFHPKIIISN